MVADANAAEAAVVPGVPSAGGAAAVSPLPDGTCPDLADAKNSPHLNPVERAGTRWGVNRAERQANMILSDLGTELHDLAVAIGLLDGDGSLRTHGSPTRSGRPVRCSTIRIGVRR